MLSLSYCVYDCRCDSDNNSLVLISIIGIADGGVPEIVVSVVWCASAADMHGVGACVGLKMRMCDKRRVVVDTDVGVNGV